MRGGGGDGSWCKQWNKHGDKKMTRKEERPSKNR